MSARENRNRRGRGFGRNFGRFHNREQYNKQNNAKSELPTLKWNVERSMNNYAQFREIISTHLISKFGNHGRFIMLDKYYEAPEIEEPINELDKDDVASSVRE